MANTIVAIFEKPEDAQQAKNSLLFHGFLNDNIDIKTASYKNEPDILAEKTSQEDVFDKIGHFFQNLFGEDHDNASRYIEAGKHGTILTVHTNDSDQADLATRILDDSGSEDVNETSGSYFPEKLVNENVQDAVYEPERQTPLPTADQNELLEEDPPIQTRGERLNARVFQKHVHDNLRLR